MHTSGRRQVQNSASVAAIVMMGLVILVVTAVVMFRASKIEAPLLASGASVNHVTNPKLVSSGVTVANHISTWVYDGSYGGRTDGCARSDCHNPTSAARIRAWVNFAEGNGANQKNTYDCSVDGSLSCRVAQYIDFNKLFSDESPDSRFINYADAIAVPNDVAFYHSQAPLTPTTRDISIVGACSRDHPCYYPQTTTPQVYSWYSTNVLQNYAKGTIFMEDNSNPRCADLFWRATTIFPVELGLNARDCNAALMRNLRIGVDALRWSDGSKISAVPNALEPSCNECIPTTSQLTTFCAGGIQAPIGALEDVSTVFGHSIADNGTGTDLDIQSVIYTQCPPSFKYVYLANSSEPPGSALQLEQRRFALANIWLGFNGSQTVFFSYFNHAVLCPNNSPRTRGSCDLSVYPEFQVFPTQPLTTMGYMSDSGFKGTGCDSSGNTDFKMVGGAKDVMAVGTCGTSVTHNIPIPIYFREFQQCYSWRTAIGRCAVILNPTDSAINISSVRLQQSYMHVMTLSGGSIVAEGCPNTGGCTSTEGITFTDSAPTTLKSDDAVFLLK